MKRKAILLIVLWISLTAGFLGVAQTVLAAEKAVQMTVYDCNA